VKSLEIPPNQICYIAKKWAANPYPQLSDDVFNALPNRLRKNLYPFQREGVKFVISRHGKALIADEMGLGKTIQAIASALY